MNKIITMALFGGALQLMDANAAVIFSGTDGTLDFGVNSGNYSLSGIQVTVAANDGIVNATGSGLGINDSSSGDDTDGLDTINLVEMLTISFDVDVMFDSLTLGGVGGDDALSASFNGAAPFALASSGQHVMGVSLLAGETLTLTAMEPNSPTPNNGVNITQFTVSAVPEPSSMTLFGLAGVVILFRRMR